MKNKKAEQLFEKISLGIKAAISQLYADAKKNGWELIISENGKVKKIKPA
jgi:hypothetical protein